LKKSMADIDGSVKVQSNKRKIKEKDVRDEVWHRDTDLFGELKKQEQAVGCFA